MPLNKIINELLEQKLKQNKKKKTFGLLQGYVSFILGLILYSYVIYINKDSFLNILNEGLLFLFFVAFPFFIIFTVLCVTIYKLINSLRNYKRDWRALLLYSVFIISFLGNKYYFKSVLGNYTVAFTISFFVFIVICIFFNGINDDVGSD